jgi:hypothetical protein
MKILSEAGMIFFEYYMITGSRHGFFGCLLTLPAAPLPFQIILPSSSVVIRVTYHSKVHSNVSGSLMLCAGNPIRDGCRVPLLPHAVAATGSHCFESALCEGQRPPSAAASVRGISSHEPIGEAFIKCVETRWSSSAPSAVFDVSISLRCMPC